MELSGFITRRNAITLVGELQQQQPSPETSQVAGFVSGPSRSGEVRAHPDFGHLPEARGFGLASNLMMDACEQRLRPWAASDVYLETAVDNAACDTPLSQAGIRDFSYFARVLLEPFARRLSDGKAAVGIHLRAKIGAFFAPVSCVTMAASAPKCFSPPLRVAIDTGGTFTDCVWIEQGKLRMTKVFSTPADPRKRLHEALSRNQASAGTMSFAWDDRRHQHAAATQGRESSVCHHGWLRRHYRDRPPEPAETLRPHVRTRVPPLVERNMRFGVRRAGQRRRQGPD